MAQMTEGASPSPELLSQRVEVDVARLETGRADKGTRMANEPNEEDRLDWLENQARGPGERRRAAWALWSGYGVLTVALLVLLVWWHYRGR